jgi:hypothetical protein
MNTVNGVRAVTEAPNMPISRWPRRQLPEPQGPPGACFRSEDPDGCESSANLEIGVEAAM